MIRLCILDALEGGFVTTWAMGGASVDPAAIGLCGDLSACAAAPPVDRDDGRANGTMDRSWLLCPIRLRIQANSSVLPSPRGLIKGRRGFGFVWRRSLVWWLVAGRQHVVAKAGEGFALVAPCEGATRFVVVPVARVCGSFKGNFPTSGRNKATTDASLKDVIRVSDNVVAN